MFTSIFHPCCMRFGAASRRFSNNLSTTRVSTSIPALITSSGYHIIHSSLNGCVSHTLLSCPTQSSYLLLETNILSNLKESGWINIEEYNSMKSAIGTHRFNLFLAGRLAAKNCLLNAGMNIDEVKNISMLANQLGAPIFPTPWTGSISHKNDYAFAAVMPSNNGSLGIDIENLANKNAVKMQRRLLTEKEKQSLGDAIPSIEEDILLRFSFKESVFKAINPFLKRYVGFLEVEVFPRSDNSASIIFHLNNNLQEQRLCEKYSATWEKLENGYCLTKVIIHV